MAVRRLGADLGLLVAGLLPNGRLPAALGLSGSGSASDQGLVR